MRKLLARTWRFLTEREARKYGTAGEPLSPDLADQLADDTLTGVDEPWPPQWFSAMESECPDTAARSEEILRDEFGTEGWR